MKLSQIPVGILFENVEDLEEGWKSKLGSLAAAGAIGLGGMAGGAKYNPRSPDLEMPQLQYAPDSNIPTKTSQKRLIAWANQDRAQSRHAARKAGYLPPENPKTDWGKTMKKIGPAISDSVEEIATMDLDEGKTNLNPYKGFNLKRQVVGWSEKDLKTVESLKKKVKTQEDKARLLQVLKVMIHTVGGKAKGDDKLWDKLNRQASWGLFGLQRLAHRAFNVTSEVERKMYIDKLNRLRQEVARMKVK